MIRVVLPTHLRRLAGVGREVTIELQGAVTLNSILDELEAQYPALRGIIREYESGQRRAYLRFFALGEDLSHQPLDEALPEPIARGQEPLRIVGAMAGG
ncbi:MAG: MoaD/ThiS family protein [Anaerolineales bacterium]|jgi:molybdopterin synthase sulfur carrier subunit